MRRPTTFVFLVVPLAVVVPLTPPENTYLVFQKDTDLFGTRKSFRNISITGSVTFSIWTKFRTQERVVFATDGNYHFSPYMFAENAVAALSIAGTIFTTTRGYENLTIGWHNFVTVVDRPASSLKFFMDGNFVTEIVLTQGELGDAPTFGPGGNEVGLIFGHFARWSDDGYLLRIWPYSGLYGYMDEVTLWDRGLDDSDIHAVYDRGLDSTQPLLYQDSVFLHYDFEDVEEKNHDPDAAALTTTGDDDAARYVIAKNRGHGGPDFDAILGAYPSLSFDEPVESWAVETSDGCTEFVQVTKPLRVNDHSRQAETANEAPVVEEQLINVVEGDEVTIYLYANDPDGDWLDFSLTTLPSHGALWEFDTLKPSNRVLIEAAPYMPTFDHFGFIWFPSEQDNTGFLVTATDDRGLTSAPAETRLTIITVNDKPQVEDSAATLFEDDQIDIQVAGADEDSYFFNVVVDTLPEHGSLMTTATYWETNNQVTMGGLTKRINASYANWQVVEPITQYAVSVHAVSTFWASPPNDEYEYPYWHPFMAVGGPSVDTYGDSREAWSPLNRNAPEGVFSGGDSLLTYGPWDARGTFEQDGYSEFIDLDFETDVYLQNVIVGMPRGMGSIVGIRAWDELTDAWQPVYEGAADADYERYMQLTRQYSVFEPYPACTTAFLTSRVRIELDTVTVADWNEIDYAQLTGTTTKQDSFMRALAGATTFKYVPDTDYEGPDSFTYRFCDCGTSRCSDPATVHINVQAVNDAPVIPTEAIEIASDCEWSNVLAIPLPASDVDANDTLTYTVTSTAFEGTQFHLLRPGNSVTTASINDTIHGNLEVVSDDSQTPYIAVDGMVYYAYDPDAVWSTDAATASLTYTVRDSHGTAPKGGADATVRIGCASTQCSSGMYFNGEACAPCPAGTYASGLAYRTKCDMCPARTYQPDEGRSICLDCGLDEFTETKPGATRCTCLPGSKIKGDLCELCPPGDFSTTIDARNCTSCRQGYYPTDNATDNDGSGVTFGARACVPCPRDTYSVEPKTALCTPCPLQRTSDPGSTVCGDCVERTYLDPETQQCEECLARAQCHAGSTLATLDIESGFWRSDPQSKEIFECPAVSSCTGGIGNTGREDLICSDNFVGRLCSLCDVGYYRSTGSGECRRCNKASKEFVYIVTTITIVLMIFILLFFAGKPAFIVELQHLRDNARHEHHIIDSMRGAAHKLSARARRLTHLNNKALPPVPVMDHRRNSKTDSIASDASMGEKDTERERRGSRRSSRRPSANGAQEKRPSRRPSMLMRAFGYHSRTESERLRMQHAQNSVTLMRMYAMLSVKWKIVISAFQILVSNSQSFLIDWPPMTTFVIGLFAIFNVDILMIAPFQCFRKLNHYDRLLATTVFPLAFIAVVGIFIITPLDALASSQTACFKKRHSRLALMVIVLFFAYSGASQTIAQTFVCQRFREEGDSFLRVDLSVRCSGRNYVGWTAFALIMTFVWPIGMPALFFCLCWYNKDRINPHKIKKKESHVSQDDKEVAVEKAVAQRQFDQKIYEIKVLWLPYEPEYWYWESIISAQRMMLTFVASLVKPGTIIQPVFCLCVALIFLRLQAFYNPYLADKDDVLAESLSWMLIFFYIQALLFMTGYINGLTMDVFMVTSIGLAILATIFLLLFDIKRELRFITVFHTWLKHGLKGAKKKQVVDKTTAAYLEAAGEIQRQVKEDIHRDYCDDDECPALDTTPGLDVIPMPSSGAPHRVTTEETDDEDDFDNDDDHKTEIDVDDLVTSPTPQYSGSAVELVQSPPQRPSYDDCPPSLANLETPQHVISLLRTPIDDIPDSPESPTSFTAFLLSK